MVTTKNRPIYGNLMMYSDVSSFTTGLHQKLEAHTTPKKSQKHTAFLQIGKIHTGLKHFASG